jgi:hypothetical protein
MCAMVFMVIPTPLLYNQWHRRYQLKVTAFIDIYSAFEEHTGSQSQDLIRLSGTSSFKEKEWQPRVYLLTICKPAFGVRCLCFPLLKGGRCPVDIEPGCADATEGEVVNYSTTTFFTLKTLPSLSFSESK